MANDRRLLGGTGNVRGPNQRLKAGSLRPYSYTGISDGHRYTAIPFRNAFELSGVETRVYDRDEGRGVRGTLDSRQREGLRGQHYISPRSVTRTMMRKARRSSRD
jgi:hypothetical protein